jgi:hypothetical protein
VRGIKIADADWAGQLKLLMLTGSITVTLSVSSEACAVSGIVAQGGTSSDTAPCRSNSGFEASFAKWQLGLAATILMCIYLAFTTLPLYSLVVQMHTTAKKKSLMRCAAVTSCSAAPCPL